VSRAVRRGADLTLACVAVVVLAPTMALIALAVRITSPGPAVFRQQRVGRDRETFTMLKFRTMRSDAPADDGALRDLVARELLGEDTSVEGSTKLAGDQRVTPLGRFLRRSSLDELPQLFNVITGRMSLVGPRPCLPWEAEMFPACYASRFQVRPGITGLWQVSGRSTMSTLQMLALDAQYAQHQRLRTDLVILLRTVPAAFSGGSR
jgi:lipopolysaccharide/colanic/teichoic acid biosynthesis glycosyltransferase